VLLTRLMTSAAGCVTVKRKLIRVDTGTLRRTTVWPAARSLALQRSYLLCACTTVDYDFSV
ncbi:hypothetical protein VXQ18_02275, partial [Brucella abortus]|nr:hypothetical protein [Brucella abortus]